MSQAYNQRFLTKKFELEFRPVRAGFVVGEMAPGLKFLPVLRVSFDYYPADAPSSILYIIK
jgi:hypothetical protein